MGAVQIGIEYPLRYPFADLAKFAATAKPYGVMQYTEFSGIGTYATLQFDLAAGKVSDAEVQDSETADRIFGSRDKVRRLKGKPLHYAIHEFFSALYSNRGMRQRRQKARCARKKPQV
jgi:hypothetical protein